MMDAVYGSGPLKRKRSTRAEVDQLEQQIFEVLAEDNPASIYGQAQVDGVNVSLAISSPKWRRKIQCQTYPSVATGLSPE
jgi:hypothetical protein